MSTLPFTKPFTKPFPQFGRKGAPAPAAPVSGIPPMPTEPPLVAAEPKASDGPADESAPAPDTGAQRKRARRLMARGAAPAVAAAERNPRLRWLLFNGGAAGAGHLAVWAVTGDPMAGAHFMARMTISVPELAAAGLTLVAAFAGWRAGGLLKGLPGIYGLAARPLGALGAALWGQGTAPLVRDVLDTVEPWGTLLSPLLAVSPVAAACWYGLDRRAAAAQLIPPVRWVLRIPLATVVASSLLYAPGVLL